MYVANFLSALSGSTDLSLRDIRRVEHQVAEPILREFFIRGQNALVLTRHARAPRPQLRDWGPIPSVQNTPQNGA